MAKRKPNDDGDQITARPNGTIDLTLNGDTYTLRRPTIGELRKMEEALDDAAADERAARDEGRTFDDTQALTEWWRDVFAMLGDDTLNDVADDDLPPWLPTAALIVEVRTHWRTVPWGPGGQPTKRIMKEATEPLQGLLNRQGA